MTNTQAIKTAVNKATKFKCFVRKIGERRYAVTTSQQHRYTVRFEMHDGIRFGICNCAAGSHDVFCYHLIPSALVDTALTGYKPHAAILKAAA
jgi:hypothetical protein